MTINEALKNTTVNVITDFSSTRERILWATLSIFVFTLSQTKDIAILSLISGWVTIILGFYFASKYHESNHAHELNMKEKQNA